MHVKDLLWFPSPGSNTTLTTSIREVPRNLPSFDLFPLSTAVAQKKVIHSPLVILEKISRSGRVVLPNRPAATSLFSYFFLKCGSRLGLFIGYSTVSAAV